MQTIPSYGMLILLFPKGFCEDLCAKVVQKNGRDESIHWKSWDLLIKSKSYRGLGFKEFHIINFTLLAMQTWRVLSNLEALCVRFLKSIYFPNEEFLFVRKKRGASWIRDSILRSRDVFI